MESTMIKEVRERIKRASKKIGKDESLPLKRCISDMLLGMLGSEDTKLSSIGRALHEKTDILYTVKRLSRNLQEMEITQAVNQYMLNERVSGKEEEEIIAIDGGDIRKNFAQKMEYLHDIYDGSRKEKAKGYQLFCMATVSKESVKPLYGELYSVADPSYKSSHSIATKALDELLAAGKDKRTFTIVGDRGYDDEKLFRYFQRHQLRFIVRLRRNREFTIEGSSFSRQVGDLFGYVTSKRTTGEVIHEGKIKSSILTISLLHGKINSMDEFFTIVIVKSPLFAEPIYLLTNLAIENYEAAYKVYAKYLKRWGIELLYRVMKEKFNIEDIRVMKYKRLRNVFALMMAALFLVSKIVYSIGNNTHFLQKKIIEKAKRLRDDGSFLYYSVADGIKAIIAKVATKQVVFDPVFWNVPAGSLFYRMPVSKNG